MIDKKIPVKRWSTILFMLLALLVLTLTACSGGEQLLLAEYNRDFEAEIFLAELGSESGDWQSLVDDAVSTSLFAGNLASFVPDTNRILIWYEDGNDLRVEQLEIGDDAPTELYEGSADDWLFGSYTTDPFLVFLTESDDFSEYSCYVAVDGAEAERVAEGTTCWMYEDGVVLQERNDDELTVTLFSLDGEDETVLLDEMKDVQTTAWNSDLSTFVYVESDGRDAQVYSMEPGDDEATAVGEEFEVITTVGFLADDKSIYVVGKPDEDDDEVGLYINGEGDPILEEEDIRALGNSEDGDFTLFRTTSTREEILLVYDVGDESVTEVADGDSVSPLGFYNEQILFGVEDNDDVTLMSAKADGSDLVELFDDNDFEINDGFLDEANGRIYLLLRDEDGLESLFVSSLDAEDGFMLVEEWAGLDLLNASDDTAVFVGQEDIGDDLILYAIPVEDGADEIELDDDSENGFLNAFLLDNGRSLIYTARDGDFEDVEVRQVSLDGEESPETLYKDVVLLDVSWEGGSNLDTIR